MAEHHIAVGGDHMDQSLTEALAPVVEELRGRFEEDLSEKDYCAVITALAKAVVYGGKTGAVEVIARLAEHGVADVVLHWDLEIPDEWAERYGDQSDAGEEE